MSNVTLEVVFGSLDNFQSEDLIFDITPFHSGYHALLGRTTFTKFNAFLHYAYLKLKMTGPSGVITINGNTKHSLPTKEHTAALAAQYNTGPYRPGCRTPVKDDDSSKQVQTRFPSWEPHALEANRDTRPRHTHLLYAPCALSAQLCA